MQNFRRHRNDWGDRHESAKIFFFISSQLPYISGMTKHQQTALRSYDWLKGQIFRAQERLDEIRTENVIHGESPSHTKKIDDLERNFECLITRLIFEIKTLHKLGIVGNLDCLPKRCRNRTL